MGYESVKIALRIALGITTIYVINTLDQTVTIQVKGNRTESTTNASEVGASFTVPAGESDFRTLVADQSGVLPYVYVEVSCSAAPASGNVTVYLVRGKDDEKKLVDALEIRDTDTHTPDTDPDKVFIEEWWR